jgi:uncharacterized protein YbjQ (UPF0145 family)
MTDHTKSGTEIQPDRLAHVLKQLRCAELEGCEIQFDEASEKTMELLAREAQELGLGYE